MSALAEKAVKAAQLYMGSTGITNIKTQQKLYTRMNAAIGRLADSMGSSESAVADAVDREARKRGAITPTPGKDF